MIPKPRHDLLIAGTLCLTFGIANMDMIGINFLTPFIKPDLGLTNIEIGMLAAGFWTAFAISSYFAGSLIDDIRKQRRTLILTLVFFSACSILPGFARSFPALLAARLLMGILAGPVLPIALTLVATTSAPGKRGLLMAVVQNLGSNIITGFIAPLLLIYLAQAHGWRTGFFIVAMPALFCALVIRHLPLTPIIDAAEPISPTPHAEETTLDPRLRRNVWICGASCCLAFAYATIGFGFLPLFYTNVRAFTPAQMSVLMSLIGVSGLVFGIFLPALSDRAGRKPVMIASGAMGSRGDSGLLLHAGSFAMTGLLFVIAWAPAAASSLFSAIVPSESVRAQAMSRILGLMIAVSTFVGGVAGPMLAGWSADRWGFAAPLTLQLGCSVAITLLSMFVVETAPRRRPLSKSQPVTV